MSDCDGTLENVSFQHRSLLKKVKFSYSWGSTCPTRSRTHDRRRGRRAVRRRHCVGGGAPVNFGRRRRRAAGPKKSAAAAARRGVGGQKHFFLRFTKKFRS